MLGFGLENMVDLMSSMVVVWRFYVGDENATGREGLLCLTGGRRELVF